MRHVGRHGMRVMPRKPPVVAAGKIASWHRVVNRLIGVY